MVWNDVINESEHAIRSVNVINNFFVINYLVDTFSTIKVFNLEGEFISEIELPKKGNISGFGGDKEDTKSVSYTHLTLPTICSV